MKKEQEFVSHELASIGAIPRTNTCYLARCACGWSASGGSEIMLAILHQSHMLAEHEARRLARERGDTQ